MRLTRLARGRATALAATALATSALAAVAAAGTPLTGAAQGAPRYDIAYRVAITRSMHMRHASSGDLPSRICSTM